MKKKFRSLLVLLCAAALLCAAVLPAVAAGGTADGSITVRDAVDGEHYGIYRIFDLESYTDDTAEGAKDGNYSYKLSTKWAGIASDAAFTAYFDLTGGYVHPKETYDESAAADFAVAALAYAKAHGITAEQTLPAANGSVSFGSLPLGYYLVDTSVGSLCSLTTTNPAVTIEEKNSAPTIEKKILQNNASVDSNNVSIGSAVQYQVTIHAKKGAVGYVLTDTLSEGLTFNNDVTVTVDGSAVAAGVNTYSVASGANNSFTVTFRQALLDTLTDTGTIVVRYSATLNEKAVIHGDEGSNCNRAQLRYGETSTTTEQTTTTDTYKFDLVKTKADGTLLAGASFRLYTARTGGTEIPLVQVDDTTYRPAVGTETGTVILTRDDRPITIQGLASGIYWLEEVRQPEGYNKLDARQSVELSGGNNTAEMNGTGYVSGGKQIINQTGTILPGTGGRGTTLFYLVGGGLMLAAVVLLVAKKRMEHRD